MAGNAGLFKFLRPSLRPQSTDVKAAAMWGVAFTSGAVWLIQVPLTLDLLLSVNSVMKHVYCSERVSAVLSGL